MFRYVIVLFFSLYHISYLQSLQDSFIYNHENVIFLTNNNTEIHLDYRSTHSQLKEQVDSIRSVFRETGLEKIWNNEKATNGNIASSVIEFLFSDGTSIKYPVNARKNYFTTITREGVGKNFREYLSTYEVKDLRSLFNNKQLVGNIGFYVDTEVQIITYLFFKDLYQQKILLSLKSKTEPIRKNFMDLLDSFFVINNGQPVLNKDNINDENISYLIEKLNEFLQDQTIVQSINNLRQAYEGRKVPGWIQIANTLDTIRKYINKNTSIFLKKVANDVIHIVLHIHTELDPCENCRILLSSLSNIMNQTNCNPRTFLPTIDSLPFLHARFTTIVSSSSEYEGNNLRKDLKKNYNKQEPIPECIFMPLNNTSNFSVSILSKITKNQTSTTTTSSSTSHM